MQLHSRFVLPFAGFRYRLAVRRGPPQGGNNFEIFRLFSLAARSDIRIRDVIGQIESAQQRSVFLETICNAPSGYTNPLRPIYYTEHVSHKMAE